MLSFQANKKRAAEATPQMNHLQYSSHFQKDYFANFGQEVIFVSFCVLACILNQAGASGPIVLNPSVTAHFHASPASENWLMASIALTSGTLILISGRIGDVFGLKITMMYGFAWTFVWSLLTGFSYFTKSSIFFTVCRALQGVGLAFILPNMIGCIGCVYKPRTLRKNMVMALVGAFSPIGSTFGAIFSGLIATLTPRWDWAFYAYAVTAAVCGVLAWYSVPKTLPTNETAKTMDWLGALLGVSAMVIFCFVWNQTPLVGWSSPYCIALLPVSVALFVAFIYYENCYARCPLLPPAVLHNPRIIAILFTIFFGWGAFGVWIFYYAHLLLNLRHYTAFATGATWAVSFVFGGMFALCCGLALRRIPAVVILLIAALGFTSGAIMLAVTPVDQSFWRLTFGAFILIVLGTDWSFSAGVITLSDELPRDWQGTAGSLANTMMNYSTSLFLGMAGTVERQVRAGGKTVLQGYRAAFYFAIGVGGISVILALVLVIEHFTRGPRYTSASQEPSDADSEKSVPLSTVPPTAPAF